MTRRMVDSVTASDLIGIPCDLVAGYVDGRYKWTDADWALFPDKVKVRIAVNASTDDGHVLDIEDGAAFPTQAPAWVRMRRAAGVDPTCYVNRSNVGAVIMAFVASGDPQPHYGLADYDNDPTLPAGFVFKQYANSALTGGHYDASVVADDWMPGGNVKVPQYAGQSVIEQDAKVGDVVVLDGVYDYGQGPRHIVRKFIATTPGVWPVTVYPPVDPDADATEVLDARPSVFVVVVNT